MDEPEASVGQRAPEAEKTVQTGAARTP